MPVIPKWLLVASCATALAIPSIGCGDDQSHSGDSQASVTTDKGKANGTSTPSSQPTTAPDPAASDEDQIKALIANVDQAFRDNDGQVICDNLAEPGKRDLAYYGELLSIPGDCAKIATAVAEPNHNTLPPPRVVKVQVNGKKAIALIRVHAGSIRQRYDKVAGTWKVHSFRVGEAVAGQPAP